MIGEEWFIILYTTINISIKFNFSIEFHIIFLYQKSNNHNFERYLEKVPSRICFNKTV